MRNWIAGWLLMIASGLAAQEFQCNVQVVSPAVQGTNKRVFETLQTALNEFMNTQRWTDHQYKPEERIECNFMFNISEVVSTDDFKASLQIQARRPVYNSTYHTTLLNIQDNDISFRYIEQQPLTFNINNFDNNLVGIMAYYAYMILGLDYDSFEQYGGSDYFKKAEQIVNRAQSRAEKGWKSFESQRNRYWIVENALNEVHKPLRQAIYQYHRKGLDTMADKPENARQQIYQSLEALRKVQRQTPGSYLLALFFTAKSDELVSIYSEAFSLEKGKASDLLQEIDPANTDKYSKLKTQ